MADAQLFLLQFGGREKGTICKSALMRCTPVSSNTPSAFPPMHPVSFRYTRCPLSDVPMSALPPMCPVSFRSTRCPFSKVPGALSPAHPVTLLPRGSALIEPVVLAAACLSVCVPVCAPVCGELSSRREPRLIAVCWRRPPATKRAYCAPRSPRSAVPWYGVYGWLALWSPWVNWARKVSHKTARFGKIAGIDTMLHSRKCSQKPGRMSLR